MNWYQKILKDDEGMIRAYDETIRDYEIQIDNTSFFKDFFYRRRLYNEMQSFIEKRHERINKLNRK